MDFEIETRGEAGEALTLCDVRDGQACRIYDRFFDQPRTSWWLRLKTRKEAFGSYVTLLCLNSSYVTEIGLPPTLKVAEVADVKLTIIRQTKRADSVMDFESNEK